MCKIGKKIFKINLFCSTIYIYIYIYIYMCALPIDQMEKKKLKKKGVSGAGMGYCPFSQLESRYNALYCDTAGARGHDTAERCMLGWPR